MKKVLFLFAIVVLLSACACRSKTCPAYSQAEAATSSLNA
ncbi:MAG: lipoprotein [Chitinophagales bacterium]